MDPRMQTHNTSPVHHLWMNREDILDHLGVSPRTLVRLVNRGEVERVRHGRRARYRVLSHTRSAEPSETHDVDFAPGDESDDDALLERIEELLHSTHTERAQLLDQLENTRRDALAERARAYTTVEKMRRHHREELAHVEALRAVAEARAEHTRERLDSVLLIALELTATRPTRKRRKELAERILELSR